MNASHGSDGRPPLDAPIALGQVGWVDRQEYYELGDGTEGEGGKTLVFVTLFRGRAPNTPLDHTQAQGQQLVCQLGGGFFRIPPKGTIVYVAIPEPFGMLPGAPIIFATSEPSPSIQFSDKRAKLDLGADIDLVIKARSVTLTDYDNRQIYVGPDGGVQIGDETGAGLQVKSGAMRGIASVDVTFAVHDGNGDVQATSTLTSGGVAAMATSQAIIKINGADITVGGGNASIATKNVNIGLGATAANFAVTTVAGTPTPSTSVWISQ